MFGFYFGKEVNMIVNLKFGFYVDVIDIPDELVTDLKKLQKNFDKWLYNKENNHGYWVVIDGKKRAVKFDGLAFVEWLNKYILTNNNVKAHVIKKETTEYNDNYPFLFF